MLECVCSSLKTERRSKKDTGLSLDGTLWWVLIFLQILHVIGKWVSLRESASLADVGQCKHLPDPQTERTPAVNNTEGTPTVRQPTNFRTLETRNRADTITEIVDTIL